MAIYKQVGYKGNILTKLREDKELFELLKIYDVIDDSVISSDENLNTYKQREATYIITGEVKQNAEGRYIRSNDNVISRDFAFLDYDDIDISDADFITLVAEKLQGYEYLLYPTIRHTEEKPRYRLILPLERPVNEQEYKNTIKSIADIIGLKNDSSSATFSQLQGVPVVTQSKADDYAKKIIHNLGNDYPIQEKNIESNNSNHGSKDDKFIDKDTAIKYFKKYLERNKSRLEQDRSEYLKPLMVIGKSITLGQIDIETAEECAELLAYGNPNYIQENIKHLHTELNYAKIYANQENKSESDYFSTRGTFIASYLPKDNNVFYDKMTGEELNIYYTESGYIIPTSLSNYITLIRHNLYIVFNELTEQAEIYDSKISKLRPIKKDDFTGIRVRIEQEHGIDIPKREIKGVVIEAGKQNPYNPIHNILQREIWDGTPRAETLFIDFLGVKDDKHTRECTKKILLAAVARNFKEYVKFDEMIILKGTQGIGKTTLLQRLGFMKHHLSFTKKADDEINIATKGKWIVELEELATLSKTDNETFKAWVSGTNDEYRGKYKEDIHNQQRRFVIFGTTNKTKFLKDPSGHRRFIVFECDKKLIKKDIFKTDNNYFYQLWAEVFKMYLDGESYTIRKETIKLIEQINKTYSEFDELDQTILEIVELPFPNGWYLLLDDKVDKEEKKVNYNKLGKYVNDLLTYNGSALFKEETKKQNDFRTKEIVGILKAIDMTDGLKDRQLESKIKKILDGEYWKESNKVERNEKKGRGYIRRVH